MQINNKANCSRYIYVTFKNGAKLNVKFLILNVCITNCLVTVMWLFVYPPTLCWCVIHAGRKCVCVCVRACQFKNSILFWILKKIIFLNEQSGEEIVHLQNKMSRMQTPHSYSVNLEYYWSTMKHETRLQIIAVHSSGRAETHGCVCGS